MGKFLDLTGKKFARLTVIGRGPEKKNTYGKTIFKWSAKCECGNEIFISSAKLNNGHTKSCGCLQKEIVGILFRTHGARHTPEYESWSSMKSRCLCETNKKYATWGGRGISITPQWIESFAQFLSDMGPRPPGTTLDRINNNGSYEKGNCRWATPKQQSNNQRTTRHYILNDIDGTLSEWAERWGCSRDAIKLRLKRGATFEQVAAALAS